MDARADAGILYAGVAGAADADPPGDGRESEPGAGVRPHRDPRRGGRGGRRIGPNQQRRGGGDGQNAQRGRGWGRAVKAEENEEVKSISSYVWGSRDKDVCKKLEFSCNENESQMRKRRIGKNVLGRKARR